MNRLKDAAMTGALGRNMRGSVPFLFAGLILANLLTWAGAWTAFAGRPPLLGLALLAWMFGLRHAVDADHIAAIDNVVRKLMHQGQRPLLTGTYFSLGHSTVVLLACAALAALAAHPPSGLLGLQGAVAAAGTIVSATVLLCLALLNIVALGGVWRRFRAAPGSVLSGCQTRTSRGGLLTRLLQPVFRLIARPWHMFPVGFVFGLGFDTTTEVGLLAIAAAQAAQGIVLWQAMVFPALFTAGMVLVDTADSAIMVGAYGWALHDPSRKLCYDLVITALSAAVALLIGGLELAGLLAGRLRLHDGLWSNVTDFASHGTELGLGIIAACLLIWASSVAMYRRRVRTNPALRLRPGSPAPR